MVQLDPHEMARHHIVSELIQTEKNFVGILNTIVTVSKNSYTHQRSANYHCVTTAF